MTADQQTGLYGDPQQILEITSASLNTLVARSIDQNAEEENREEAVMSLNELFFSLPKEVQRVEISIEVPGVVSEGERVRKPVDVYDEEADITRLLRMQLASIDVPNTGNTMRTTLTVERPTIEKPTLMADQYYGNSGVLMVNPTGAMGNERDMETSAFVIPLKFIRKPNGIKVSADPKLPVSPAPKLPPQMRMPF